MPKTVEVEVIIKLSPMTFIDRDEASWSVTESTFEGVPTLELNTVEEDGFKRRLAFYKDDAAFILLLIKEAANKQ